MVNPTGLRDDAHRTEHTRPDTDRYIPCRNCFTRISPVWLTYEGTYRLDIDGSTHDRYACRSCGDSMSFERG